MGLKEIVDVSRRYGSDGRYVLAGGGNTSFKDRNSLYVKASGTTLAGLTEDGLVKMDRSRLAGIWERQYSSDPDEREREALADLMAARAEGETKRPSVETLLHDLLDKSHVVHLHPSLVNGLTCARRGEEIARELFGETMLWIPVVNPGYVLAKHIRDAIGQVVSRGGDSPQILLLENHGIFVADDSVDEIVRIYDHVMTSLAGRVTREPSRASNRPAASELSAGTAADIEKVLGRQLGAESIAMEGIAGPEALRVTSSEDSFEPLRSFGYTPDHLVYCKAAPIWIPAGKESDSGYLEEAVTRFREQYKAAPRLFAVEGKGAIAAADTTSVAESAAALFEDLLTVVGYAESFGGPRLMPKDKIDFILNWEVESYRAKVSRDEE